ncbi:ABC transporter substrate-binding protein [Mesorhizobium sp. YC-39]|uniref:ABC transporter substrate-binding protein n=1 Tax=unclassified Mesorhizobium TaxID=325217 RepID=UPI0021E8101B|nr:MULTISPECIES: ABC transporter substrate-binding protein [unclassified Mesorhizobium]MCV3211340.1 ABC transporter substrate-binding protein [Mesorhizobium sp. YC-2]MCV3232972.1 ABC transporter substrate-binding protein [Mesorhizobium sp. YC-39]
MKRLCAGLLATAIATFALGGAALAETIKVGVIATFSGPNAIWGKQFKEAIQVYVAQHGNEVNGNTIEFIYKDVGGPNPDASKAAAQELLIRDGVKYLAGFDFTPNALAVAPLINQAKVPAIIFNAATSAINKQSKYFVRTSFTLWQVAVPAAQWAAKNGAKKVVTAVSDYNPGIDAETAFGSAFEQQGGTIVEKIRMPLQTNDFAPFMQRIKNSGADTVFAFLPAGPATFAFTKAYSENGLKEAGIGFIGTGETDETTIDSLGEQAVGLTTAYHYSDAHTSDLNRAFTAKLAELFPKSRANMASMGAYDGAHLIYKMIELAGTDGDKAIEAAKGLSWESPRGPVSIDPTSRHVVQNVYIRRVERDGGRLVNREFDLVKSVPDLGFDR